MIRTLLITTLMLLISTSFALAGAVDGDITVWSEVEGVDVYADGVDSLAQANIHSVMIQEGTQIGAISISGTVNGVNVIASGSNARAVANVGTVQIGYF